MASQRSLNMGKGDLFDGFALAPERSSEQRTRKHGVFDVSIV